jgi:hypothetical protein
MASVLMQHAVDRITVRTRMVPFGLRLDGFGGEQEWAIRWLLKNVYEGCAGLARSLSTIAQRAKWIVGVAYDIISHVPTRSRVCFEGSRSTFKLALTRDHFVLTP